MNWMTKDWTQGDLNAIIKKIGGEEVARGILNGTVQFTVTELPKPVLVAFFQTRPGLWVSDDFRRLVVAKVSGVAKAVATKSFDLLRDMSDSEIEAELGDGHIIWEKGDLSVTLEQMITEQWGGKAGKLLNNGLANLFYTSSCVVHVSWRSDAREWSVDTWGRSDSRWFGGLRAFSQQFEP